MKYGIDIKTWPNFTISGSYQRASFLYIFYSVIPTVANCPSNGAGCQSRAWEFYCLLPRKPMIRLLWGLLGKTKGNNNTNTSFPSIRIPDIKIKCFTEIIQCTLNKIGDILQTIFPDIKYSYIYYNPWSCLVVKEGIEILWSFDCLKAKSPGLN